MHSHAAAFHDPKPSSQRLDFESTDQGRQSLQRDGADIMARTVQQLPPAFAQILVELDFHDASSGMSTNRSRAISEP